MGQVPGPAGVKSQDTKVSDISWRIGMDTFVEWKYLMDQAMSMTPGGPEAEDLIDQIRRLPNFPNNFDEFEDTIIPDVIKTRESWII